MSILFFTGDVLANVETTVFLLLVFLGEGMVRELHNMELWVEKPGVSQEVHLEQDSLLHKEQPLNLFLPSKK